MNKIHRLITKIGRIGIPETDSFALKRRKEFFNIITIIGGLASIPQAIAGFQFDFYAGIFHLTWGAACILSVFVHYYVGFKVARVVTFIPVFVLGSCAAARLGYESYAIIGSLTIFLGIFFLHDLRKEWGWVLFYFLIECAAILMIESNYFKSESAPDVAAFSVRAGTLIGTVSFLAIEMIYFIRIGLSNENHVNQKLRKTNLVLNERNEEKDLLLKEIHHRVKNNLQIISSLLRLQSHEIDDVIAKGKFIDSVNRIKSISNLHETIYKSENIVAVEMNDYLKNLALSIIESYSLRIPVELDIRSESIDVDNDHIVPISLILNEMISNSVKHGFVDSKRGKISIFISSLNDSNKYRLNYSDSGSWTDAENNNSFGTELIQSLVDQLNGTIERKPNEEKSEYSIHFEVNKSNRI
ncbi:MAG: sensor histidine kinase [Crocinitomicaceae bacterium]|nr:sensor histidine kinase [Crocinitomicaceae bacterium]